MQAIQLSDHFTRKRLLRYSLPSIVMMVFTSIYGVVDGYFVSNYTGKTPFAAVNLIMPFLMILGGVGFMFGTGGGALIAKTMGEGKAEKADKLFSMTVFASILCGLVLTAVGLLFLRPFARLMGAEGELLENSLLYGTINLIALPFYILQYEFQCLFATAEKPKLGLYVTVASGVANMVLDWLLVAVLSFGLAGAAAATAASQFIGGVFPLVYFARKNSSRLRLTRCRLELRPLGRICANGSSELMSNISMSLVSMLYNVQLMQYAGEDGIAAYGVLMYVSMIFQAIFIGYSVGTAPIVSYHYGAQNREELKSLLRKAIFIVAIAALCMFAAGELLAAPLSRLFVAYDEELLQMTTHAFAIFSFSFLFSGFAINGSSFFTALNDGLTSALISFLRTLVFQVAAVLLFPLLWGLDGIWFSIVAAEIMAVLATIFFLLKKQKKYGY
ncbi:MAG: MATE family efflux transporter [Lachnospiraceae bacterium]